MPTPIFSPLTALHRPGQSIQKVQRELDRLSSPAGVFSVRPHSDFPGEEHALDLVFFDAQEAADFLTFFYSVLGAFGAWWVPSYQQDLTPIGMIGAADVTFLIESVGYAETDFGDPARRQIAFVQPNGVFLKRTIIDAVENRDGTESITINAALGISFSQNDANGICFLWYCRFSDDVVRLQWIDADRATAEIAAMELTDAPDGGSGISTDGFLLDGDE